MWRVLKWVLVGAPLALSLGVVTWQGLEARRVKASFTDPADVAWGEGDSAVRVRVTEERGADVEIRTLHVEALDARGESLAGRSLQINEDLWGGGFVSAMQVDDDPALEVVAWGAHESDESRFYFDLTDEGVTVQPFSRASEEARALALERHQVEAGRRASEVVLIVLSFFYYAALGLVWIVVRVVASVRRRTAASVPQGDNP